MAMNPQRSGPETGTRMSVEEYFRLEYTIPGIRYEYLNGAVRMMAGGSGEHDLIAYNIRAAIDINFRSGPCFVRGSDMRVQVSNDDDYCYPDVTVSCDVSDRRRGNKLMRSARIVVEVLSPSTEKADRNEKFKTYQAYPTIQEIVLISQFAPHVEVFRRPQEEGANWSYEFYGPGQEVMLESVDVSIPIEEIYQNVNFDEPLVEE